MTPKPQAPPVAPSVDFPQMIAVAALRRSPTNPRKDFDPAFINEMAESMKQDGVLTALLVRPSVQREIGGIDTFEIVSGEQRYRAAKQAGLLVVPCLVRNLTDDKVMSIQLVENLKRKDLTALEEADGYNAMVNKGTKVERVAEEIGRSPKYVYDRLRLMALVPDVRDLLLTKRIELGHAQLLAEIAPDDQRRVIRENGGGLWTSQRTMWIPGDSRVPQQRTDDSFKPVSVKELKIWIDDRVKFRVDDPVNLQLFPETVAAVQAAQETKTKIVHITHEHQVHPDAKDEKGPRVFTEVSWRRADGKGKSKTCDRSALGIIDIGPLRGQALMVCVDRKNCTVHFADAVKARVQREKAVQAAVVKSGATGEDRHEVEKEARASATREAERKHQEKLDLLEKAMPAISRSLAEALKKAPAGTGSPAGKLLLQLVDEFGYRPPSVDTALRKALPPGKTAEDLVRFAAWIYLQEVLEDQDLSQMTQELKPFGVDVAKILAAHAKPVVDKCRVCGCTDETPCDVDPTTGLGCWWTEKPNKKTKLGLCSSCAAKTGNKSKASSPKGAKSKAKK